MQAIFVIPFMFPAMPIDPTMINNITSNTSLVVDVEGLSGGNVPVEFIIVLFLYAGINSNIDAE